MVFACMIVTDSSGYAYNRGAYGFYTDQTTGKKDPYRLYGMANPNIPQDDPANSSEAEAASPNTIQMLLSQGGVLSGVYRYPRIGEKVLVSGSGPDYYMVGYIPDKDNNPFFDDLEGDDIDDKIFTSEGLLIRYGNTAQAFGIGAKLYSGIGFYRNEKAEWPASAGGTDYPSIDTIGIDSAGDLREGAANHHLQQCGRMEILANTPEMYHATCKVDAAGTPPLGDYPGDDSYLHKGDVHARAGNRVIIKAAREIRLQVGRTMLRIGDDGFNVITRNVCGNYINSYDTSLSMTPRDGVALNGKNINVQAGYRLNVGDGMGGAVSTAMGNLSMSGRELSMDSFNTLEYKFMILYQGLDYLVNAASGSMALSGEADVRIAEYIKFTVDNLEELLKLGRRFSSVWAERKKNRAAIEESQRPVPAAPVFYAVQEVPVVVEDDPEEVRLRQEEENQRQEDARRQQEDERQRQEDERQRQEDERRRQEDESNARRHEDARRRQEDAIRQQEEENRWRRTEIGAYIYAMFRQRYYPEVIDQVRDLIRHPEPEYVDMIRSDWVRHQYSSSLRCLGLANDLNELLGD